MENLWQYAELLEEAADVISRMPVKVFDELQVRHFLCDELQGTALMMRDDWLNN